MTYNELVRLFNTRRSGRDYKVMWSSGCRLTMNEDRHIVAHVVVQWRRTNGKPDYVYEPLAIAKPGDTVTLIKKIGNSDNSHKNVFAKLIGRNGSIQSDTSNYRTHEHTMRYVSYGYNAPAAPGLVVHMRSGRPLAHAEDVKRRVNRAKAQPVYDHVPKVLNMMDVLWRIGALPSYDAMTGSTAWRARRDALKTANIELADEALADQAEKAFMTGSATAGYPKMRIWDPRTGQVREVPEHEWKATWYAEVRAKAARHLREALKHAHDAFDKEVVQPAKIAA